MYSSFNVYLKLIEFLIKNVVISGRKTYIEEFFLWFLKHLLIELTCTVPGISESSAVNGFVKLLNTG